LSSLWKGRVRGKMETSSKRHDMAKKIKRSSASGVPLSTSFTIPGGPHCATTESSPNERNKSKLVLIQRVLDKEQRGEESRLKRGSMKI